MFVFTLAILLLPFVFAFRSGREFSWSCVTSVKFPLVMPTNCPLIRLGSMLVTTIFTSFKPCPGLLVFMLIFPRVVELRLRLMFVTFVMFVVGTVMDNGVMATVVA